MKSLFAPRRVGAVGHTPRLLAALWVALVAAPVLAQTAFPHKPVRVITQYAAGSSTDITARIFAEGIKDALGQSVIVENRPGGNGQLAINAVRGAEADGYTLLFAGAATMAYQPFMDPTLTGMPDLASTIDSFRAIGFANTFQLVFITGPGGPQTMAALIAQLRSPDGKATYASLGPGTAGELSQKYLLHLVKGNATAIAYKSPTIAFTDLMSDRLTMAVAAFTPAVEGPIKERKLRALATASKLRIRELPNVPTIAEAGLPAMAEVNWDSWFGFFARKETPNPIAQKLNESVRISLKSPAVVGKLEKASIPPHPPLDLREAEAEWKLNMEKAKEVLKAVGQSAR